MATQREQHRVNIRPEVSILSVLRHLNYKPWFALAEFVDNSLQSFVANEHALRDGSPQLKVDIIFEAEAPGRIVVRDNAAGISESDYARAFKPAEVPPDRTGLSEFGMGMKSAACWLAKQWSVRTSALNENVEREIAFDVADIVQNRIENLDIAVARARPDSHFTELTLQGLHNVPQGRTIGKIKEHLAGIYRYFLRDGLLVLTFNGEPLTYQDPPILRVPFYRTPEGEGLLWRKEINFDFGDDLKATGFAALREKASVSSAGFSLFRRKRLIQGSGDEGYRPSALFGQSNSYTYQRLFGELHLDGFEVSHTKDGFRWEEHEEVFLELLAEHLDEAPLPLLAQAEGHRVRLTRSSLQAGARTAAERTAGVIERDVPEVLAREIDAGPDASLPPEILPATELLATERSIDIELRGQPWRIIIELTTDPAIGDWISLSDLAAVRDGAIERRTIAVRMSLAHPFTDRFGGTDAASIEPLLRLAAAIGLAETAARDSGVTMPGTFRRNINELLKTALSNP